MVIRLHGRRRFEMSCACGCGSSVNVGRKFRRGHNMLGTKRKAETVAKVAAAQIGQNGSKSRRWRGDDAGYSAIHMWLKIHKQKTGVCENCGEAGKSGKTQFANISGEYKRDTDDYAELCPSCHR